MSFRKNVRKIFYGVSAICIFLDIYALKEDPYVLKRGIKNVFFIKERDLSDIYPSVDTTLTKGALEAIDEICNHDFAENEDDYNPKYLDILNIDEKNVTKAYTKFSNDKIVKHQNSSYYDEEKDDINWDILTRNIYQNGILLTKKMKNRDLEELSFESVQKKVKNLKNIVNKVRQDFPEYDIKMLACNLEDYSLLEYYEDTTLTIASTENYEKNIAYNTYYTDNKSKKEIMEIDYHEDFHVIVQNCKDYEKWSQLLRPVGGVGICNKDYLVDANEFSLDYSFIEEIYAELYSSQVAGIEQSSYIYYDEVLKVLQLALGLDDDYQIDSILTDLIYRDPISFIGHFPVYGEDKNGYFVNNCKMLKAYDIELNNMEYYKKLLKDKGFLDDYESEEIDSIQLMATSQLSKIFFNNLIVMNEKHASELTLIDNYYMVQLFVKCINNSLVSMYAENMYAENDKMITLEDTSCSQDKNTFFDYLSNKYQIDRNKLVDDYYTICQLDNYSFPDFLGEEKKSFYQQLFMEENNNIEEPYAIPLQIHPYTFGDCSKEKDSNYISLEKKKVKGK